MASMGNAPKAKPINAAKTGFVSSTIASPGLFNALYLPKEVTEMQHTAAIVHPAAR